MTCSPTAVPSALLYTMGPSSSHSPRNATSTYCFVRPVSLLPQRASCFVCYDNFTHYDDHGCVVLRRGTCCLHYSTPHDAEKSGMSARARGMEPKNRTSHAFRLLGGTISLVSLSFIILPRTGSPACARPAIGFLVRGIFPQTRNHVVLAVAPCGLRTRPVAVLYQLPVY
ncbi:hypothetical protein F5B21DRAFT_267675 [Xylaria acuta]|nr:hypothetical protein F5B21DRAFT_267675 [Xylaria acuta]